MELIASSAIQECQEIKLIRLMPKKSTKPEQLKQYYLEVYSNL